MQLQKRYQNNIKWLLVVIFLIVVVFVYKNYNPNKNNYFPKCIVLKTIGYKCVGCGSQRAVHSLLNFNIKQAAYYNIILVLSIPYLLLGAFFDFKKNKTQNQIKWQRKLYGTKAIWIITIIILFFLILRNTSFWLLN